MKMKIIYGVIAIVLLSSFFIIKDIAYGSNIDSFEISIVEELDGRLTVITESRDNIDSYHTLVYDIHDNLLYDVISDTNRIDISSLYLNYNEEVIIKVIGYNDKEQSVTSNYNYINKRLSFNDESENVILDSSDVKLLFDGEYDNYHIHLMHNNLTIYKTDLSSDELVIPFDVFEGLKGRVIAQIENENDIAVDTYNIYIDPVLVDDIILVRPDMDDTFYYGDVAVTYVGGENATTYRVNVYDDGKLMGSSTGENGKIIVDADLFDENKTYELELVAQYLDFTELAKKDSVTINIREKLEVLPVTVNYDFTNIDAGSLISLETHTEGASIYYSIDGSDPIDGELYESPILVKEGMEISAIAVKENCKDSVIRNYPITIGDDQPIIYLSPSNQYGNLGVSEVGYYNEKLITHQITDYLEEYLIDMGFKIYRNNPNDDMSIWMAQSRGVGSDLHLAIHTNGSVDHDTQGMEIYVHEPESPALSIARHMYDHLYDIYPYQSTETDRGVKYAQGALGEVNKANIEFGILIEIAFHDYYDDALWVMENREEIALNIGESLVKYYQMDKE